MNTKLKFLAITAIAAIGCAAGISFASSDYGDKRTALTLINVEALSNGEGSGESIPCHSSSSRNYNAAYVDCASCTRIEGWKGSGTQAACRR